MTSFFNSSHYKDLEAIVGRENIYIDLPHRSAYSFDSTRLQTMPDCVIFPCNEAEVVEIVRYANTHHIPITPRGAGSGMSGGSINSGIILALQKHFNKILELDEDNLCVIAQPGVINQHLNQFLKPYGLFFAPDPASQAFSTLGGNIAENAGGMSAVKYGVSKDNVLAMRAVLGNGEVLSIGHRTYKDVAGYDLLGLMCGSEGTLGIITELTLKLKAIPLYSSSVLICFENIDDLAKLSCEILKQGIVPYAMEFLDSYIIQALNQQYQIYPSKADCVLMIKLTSHTQAGLDEELTKIETMASNCLSFQKAQSQEEEERLWFGRRNASQANSVYGVKKLNEDITLPRNQIARFLHYTKEISKKYHLVIPCFGHIGDGNIHTNVMLKDLSELEMGHQAVQELFEIVLHLGGTLSGEHGIGLTKAPFMPLAFSQAHLDLFKQIKQVFDPKGILNPHKIFS